MSTQTADRPNLLDAEMVSYDARPGDAIYYHGRNYRVINTYPGGVDMADTTPDRGALPDDVAGGTLQRIRYDVLRREEAYYLGRFIPCRTPAGLQR